MNRKAILFSGAAGLAALLATTASAEVMTLTFADGLAGGGSAPADEVASFDIVEDGVTLTIGAIDGILQSTTPGVGIEPNAGVSPVAAQNAVNVDAGEVFTFTFDTDSTAGSLGPAGTLDSLEITTLLNSGSSDDGDLVLTFVNTATSASSVITVTPPASGTSFDVVVGGINLAFSDGDVITLVHADTAGFNDDYRLESVTATVVPEPGTITLGVFGAAAMLFRRRK